MTVKRIVSLIAMLMFCCVLSVPAQAAASTKKTITLAAGECGYIDAGGDNGGYVWTSSDSAVVSTENGVIMANKAGKAKITASLDGKSRTYSVAVKKYRIAKASSTLSVGERMQLSFKGCPVSAEVTWTSSDSSVLTVTDFGMVTALKAGTAKITGKYKKSSVTTAIKVKNGKKPPAAESSFKANINAADVAYIKYDPPVTGYISARKFGEISNFITDRDEIEKIVSLINEREYVPLSDEEISEVYQEDVARWSKKYLMTFIVRDDMILYDKNGREIAVLSSNEKIGGLEYKLARLYVNGKYYKCEGADTRLTTAGNRWKSDEEIISAAKEFCKEHGVKVSGKITIRYQEDGLGIYRDKLDKSNIAALVMIKKNEVVAAPATGLAIGFEDMGSDD